MILTLKDQGVLDEGDDVLVNVNMIDDERYKKVRDYFLMHLMYPASIPVLLMYITCLNQIYFTACPVFQCQCFLQLLNELCLEVGHGVSPKITFCQCDTSQHNRKFVLARIRALILVIM